MKNKIGSKHAHSSFTKEFLFRIRCFKVFYESTCGKAFYSKNEDCGNNNFTYKKISRRLRISGKSFKSFSFLFAGHLSSTVFVQRWDNFPTLQLFVIIPCSLEVVFTYHSKKIKIPDQLMNIYQTRLLDSQKHVEWRDLQQ